MPHSERPDVPKLSSAWYGVAGGAIGLGGGLIAAMLVKEGAGYHQQDDFIVRNAIEFCMTVGGLLGAGFCIGVAQDKNAKMQDRAYRYSVDAEAKAKANAANAGATAEETKPAAPAPQNS